MTNQELLEQAYEATAEDFLYAVGLFAVPDQPPAPLIQLHYREWSREQLEVIRATFGAGITLIHDHRPDQGHDFHLATRKKIAVRVTQDAQTCELRAPAWNAHLAAVDPDVAAQFADQRQRLGGFLLLIQGQEWEFMTAVDDSAKHVHVGPIQPLSLPPPPGAKAP